MYLYAIIEKDEDHPQLKKGIHRVRPVENDENQYDIDRPGFDIVIKCRSGHPIYTIPPIMGKKNTKSHLNT